MKCSICGSDSAVEAAAYDPERLITDIARRCTEGHLFYTVEAHPTQLADAREMRCAVRRIERRMALYKRDAAIAADPRPAAVVAAEHGVTDTRVRQIRASFRRFQEGAWHATMLTINSERKSR